MKKKGKQFGDNEQQCTSSLYNSIVITGHLSFFDPTYHGFKFNFKLKGDAKTLAKIIDLEKQARDNGDEDFEEHLDLSDFVEEN